VCKAHSEAVPKGNEAALNEDLRAVTVPENHFPEARFFMDEAEERIACRNHAGAAAVFVAEASPEEVPIDIGQFLRAVVMAEDERIESAPAKCSEVIYLSITPGEQRYSNARIPHDN
jgi:hypothetical protein